MFFDRLLKLTTLKTRLLSGTSFSQLYSAENLPLRKFRKEGAMLSPLIAGLLAACGGGGGGIIPIGGAGNDRLIGGTGSNILTGGNGDDIFDFGKLSENFELSRITDFKANSDNDQLFIKLKGKQFNTVKRAGEDGLEKLLQITKLRQELHDGYLSLYIGDDEFVRLEGESNLLTLDDFYIPVEIK